MRPVRSNESKTPEYGSDIVAEILKIQGIEYVSANIGSTFRAVWDSIINFERQSPKPISACHEEIAIAMAHGYAKAALKPMAVLVHDLVGLQHASMAIYNAWCDRVPIVILGASGPMGTDSRRPWIDWIHTGNIPNTLVRDYVKWDDFPFTIGSVAESMIRGYGVAVADPQGPIFICFDTAYLEEKVGSVRLPDFKRYALQTAPRADEESLLAVAKALISSESPFLVAGRVGRRPEGAKLLIRLAETLGAKVIDQGDCFNFPNTHPLDAEAQDIGDADCVLAIEAPSLERALFDVDMKSRGRKPRLRRNTRIFSIGLDQFAVRSWAADSQRLLPADIRIAGESSSSISRLCDISAKLLSKDRRSRARVGARILAAKSDSGRRRRRWLAEAKKRFNDNPISPPRLAFELWEKVKGEDWVIANGDLAGWARRLWDWERPGCYLGRSGGSGLGYGLPASIGAALALKPQGKLVIDLQADGDLLFSPSALWTAAHYSIPFLAVVFNNRSYYNDAEHNRLIAKARGRDEEKAYHTGGDITDPNVDYADLAASYGVWSSGPIQRPDELSSSIGQALEVVLRKKKPALLDVVTAVR